MDLKEILTFAGSVLNYELFRVSDTPVTLLTIILFFLVLSSIIILGGLFRKQILRRLLERMGVAEGQRYTLQRIFSYLFFFVGLLIAFQFVGINLSGLVVIFGALSVGIGFGLQNVTANFISGLIILFERPIQVGDRVTINDLEGDVDKIKMRATTIKTIDNISIIVPNLDFVSNAVINWSHDDPKVRISLDVGVSYASDLDTVLRSLREAAEEEPRVLTDPKPDVLLVEFGDSAWNMRLRAWIANPKEHREIRSALNCAIVHKFRANNVEIPFPQRDLHLRSPLPLPLDDRALADKQPSSGEQASGDH